MIRLLADTQPSMGTAHLSRKETFREFYGRHFTEVERFVLRRAGSSIDADDAVAEVFLVAWRRFEEIADPETELAWLYGVAGKVLANQRRSSARRSRLWDRLAREPAPTVEVGHVADGAHDALVDAISRLKLDQREVLLLAYWEGLRPREIAVVLGCSANAARIRLHRAHKRLEEELVPTQREKRPADAAVTTARGETR